jgi:zinc transport system permease protein
MGLDALMTYGFLQRAFLSGLFIAVACALLGVFLILRRDAMIGHGLSHITFAGIALGLFLNVLPLLTALIVAVLTALVIMFIKQRAGLHGDTAIAIFSSLGLAVGIMLASLANRFNVGLLSYLFGEILAIRPIEVWLSLALAGVVVIVVVLNYHRFLFITFDRESARASGMNVGRSDILITLLTAVTVVLGMKVVGILLVSALIVIPAAAGLQLAGSFKQAIFLAIVFGVLSVSLGLLLSVYLDLPASGSIVLLSFVIFGLCALRRRV